jgi:hypothetical protein
MSGPGIAITMMAIEVITTAEEHGVENCGKPASTRKSWASKGWAIAAGIANSAGRLVDPQLLARRVEVAAKSKL